jgi:hypothetical protein
MKKILVTLLVLSSLNTFAQTLTQSVPLNVSKKSDVFQVVEEDKKQISLFFNDKLKVRTVRFDEKFNIIDSLSSDRPSKDYDDIIGYSISGNKYYSYWSSSNNKEIASQCFDFEGKKVSMNTHTLEFVKEKPIKKITVNNVFYLITIVKNTSVLNFYVFKDGKMEKKSVDLPSKNFVTYDNQRTNLWEILTEATDFEPSLSVQNILEETPPSLAFSANRRKTYVEDNSLIFTFDNNTSFTQFLTINLLDFTFTLTSYTQPYIEQMEFDEIKSNSFLINDHIVQVKLNSGVMYISVNDLDGNELKKFSIFSEKEISFKNSEIIQENGSIKNTRVLDKSNQLMRKISSLNPSISCYSFDDKIYLTIGGVSLVQNNSAIMYGGMIGGLTGALIGAALSSNYSMNNLNSYKKRKVVYINCQFDQEFNHIKGDIKKLAFDELRAFSDEHSELECQTVFKMNSTLYLGGYSKESKSYSFYSFND